MAIIALAAIAALLIWGFGSTLARFAGALAIIEGLLRIGIKGPTPTAYTVLGIGLAVWLAGHWLFAAKHKTWRSRLALTAFSLPLVHYLAPIPTNRPPKVAMPHGGRETIWPSNRGQA